MPIVSLPVAESHRTTSQRSLRCIQLPLRHRPGALLACGVVLEASGQRLGAGWATGGAAEAAEALAASEVGEGIPAGDGEHEQWRLTHAMMYWTHSNPVPSEPRAPPRPAWPGCRRGAAGGRHPHPRPYRAAAACLHQMSWAHRDAADLTAAASTTVVSSCPSVALALTCPVSVHAARWRQAPPRGRSVPRRVRVRSSDPPSKCAARIAGPPGQSLYPEAGTGGPKYITWEQDSAGLNNVRLQVRSWRTCHRPLVAHGHPGTRAWPRREWPRVHGLQYSEGDSLSVSSCRSRSPLGRR